MKDRYLKARIPHALYEALQKRAAESGMRLATLVRELLERDAQAIGIEQVLARVEAAIAAVPASSTPAPMPVHDHELRRQVHELRLVTREIAMQLNAQILTQQALAELVGVHLTQIQRYEKGDTQPTLEVIRKLALALAVSADALVFDADERGPGDNLKLQFEAVRQLPAEDQRAIKAMLDGMIVKHRTRQLADLHAGSGA